MTTMFYKRDRNCSCPIESAGKENCVLCSEIRPQYGKNCQKGTCDILSSRILAKNDTLFLIPALGCFIKGYVLLSTLEHYVSLVNCPDPIVTQVDHTIRALRRAFKQRLKTSMIFFEHGTVDDSGLSAASVLHFHMHFLPAIEAFWEKAAEMHDFQLQEVDGIPCVKEFITSHKISAYFLLGDVDQKLYVVDCSRKRYPSQFLRKITYEFYCDASDKNWDWRREPFYELMGQTKDAFLGIKL